MKRAFPVFLALALLLSLGFSALATDPVSADPVSETAEEVPAIAAIPPTALYGFIVEELENGSILVQSEWDENNRVILNISDDTFVVDAQTGLISSLADRESDRVAVFYGPVTTRSMIPQSNAVAIAVNLPENAHSPHYAKVEQIVRGEDSVRILTDGGSLYITIRRESPIAPYRTRNIVSIDNLRVGSELMVWYDMVALSYPGQTTANRTVILRDGPAGDVVTVSAAEGIATVNGSDLELVAVRASENGAAMLPLRQLCEALGYTVNWLAETNAVEIVRDEVSVTLTFGSPVLIVDGKLAFFSQIPMVDNGITFVPADFFEVALAVNLFSV